MDSPGLTGAGVLQGGGACSEMCSFLPPSALNQQQAQKLLVSERKRPVEAVTFASYWVKLLSLPDLGNSGHSTFV